MTKEEIQGKQTKTLLEHILEIIGEENLPKSSDSNLKICLVILEELAAERGLDYLKKNRELIIDQIEMTDKMF